MSDTEQPTPPESPAPSAATERPQRPKRIAAMTGREHRNAPLGKEFWARIRAAYVLGLMSARDLADDYGVHETSIRRRCAIEGWLTERKRLKAGKGQLIAGRFGAETTEVLTAVPGDPYVAANDEALKRHARITDRYLAIVEASMEELLQMQPGRPKAESIRHCGEALARAITLSREVRGIKPGEASAEDIEQRPSLRVVVSPTPTLAKAVG